MIRSFIRSIDTRNPNPIEKNLIRMRNDLKTHRYPFLFTLYEAVLILRPMKIVEWGTKTGATAITMGMAAKKLGNCWIYSYDRFEKEVFNSVSLNYPMEKTAANLLKYNMNDIVSLKEMDFWEWIKDPTWFELLYLDINNDGGKIKALYDAVKGMNRATILFEGGSVERDKVPWMKDRLPINSIKEYVNYSVIDERWPSLSMIKL